MKKKRDLRAIQKDLDLYVKAHPLPTMPETASNAELVREMARFDAKMDSYLDQNPQYVALVQEKNAVVRNPSPVATAQKKAKAWYRDDSLVTKPEVVDWKAPKSAIHIGRIVAIEYESDKFDGVKRIYRHDVTKIREMLVSPDGTTIIVLPGFKITTRGIEG